jgi:hypothetical protein
MHKTTPIFSKLAVLPAILLFLSFAGHSRADDYLPTFRVGGTVYSNVTVLTKTSSDIYFKHSYGFGNTKVREVDRATLLALGYQLPPDEAEKTSVFHQSAQHVLESQAVTNLVADPRVQEAQALLTAQMGDLVEKITPEVIHGFVAGFIAIYLFFSFCCRQICVKTGQNASPLVWLPIFKQLPLLRAANMTRWWLLPALLFFPIVWPLMKIIWSFKICPQRGKSWVVGLFLLLPVTNIFAFLYLAFSGNGESEPASSVISLGPPPSKRAAA